MADEKSVPNANPAKAVSTPPIPTKDTRNEKNIIIKSIPRGK